MLDYLSVEEFNEFAAKHEQSTFFQSSMWGDLKKNNGWTPYIVGIKEGYDIKGATLLLAKKIPVFNKYIFYAPRGFLINYKSDTFLENFSKQVINFVKKKHGIFLKINPYVPYQERDIDGNIVENGFKNDAIIQKLQKIGFKHNGFTINYGIDLEPRWLSVLDLRNKNYDDIYEGYNKLKKRHMKSISKLNFKLVEIDESRMDEYKKMMSSTSIRRGFIDRPLSYYNKMYDIFKPNDIIKVMFVEINFMEKLNQDKNKFEEISNKIKSEKTKDKVNEKLINELNRQIEAIKKTIMEDEKYVDKYGDNDIPISSGLFMCFGPEVVYLFGANYEEFMSLNGATYLMDKMIKYAIDNNYERYNFYGITGHFEPSHPMYGLFDFKRGFGAKVVELIGEFNIVTNKLFYPIYKLMYYFYKKSKR